MTMVLLVLLGAMFLRGFREVIAMAVVIVGVYLLLNVIVIGSGLGYLRVSSRTGSATWYQPVVDRRLAHRASKGSGLAGGRRWPACCSFPSWRWA